MKKLPIIISMFIVVLYMSCFIPAHAANTEFPYVTDGVGYAKLSDALSASSSGIVTMVHTASESGRINIPVNKRLIISNGVTLYHSTDHINVYGDLILYGNIVDTSSIRIYSGTTNLYGTVSNDNVSAFNVTGKSNVYFNGVVISAANYAVAVASDGIGSTLVVNGGTFYSTSQESPLNPIDAFTFEDGSQVTIENGLVVSVANNSVLHSVTQMVTASTSWIGIFMGAVISQALLTLICSVAFIGIGIGLIKRIKR